MPNPREDIECKRCHDTGLVPGTERLCACVGNRAQCGPDPASWFSAGQWPKCACGYDPKNNNALTVHWRAAGFTVIDVDGRLMKAPVVS